MTSMPASRRARAITLAPRSWPSRPGLATKTRIRRSIQRCRCLKYAAFVIQAEDAAQRLANLADCGGGAHCFQYIGHFIPRVSGRFSASAFRVPGYLPVYLIVALWLTARTSLGWKLSWAMLSAVVILALLLV